MFSYLLLPILALSQISAIPSPPSSSPDALSFQSPPTFEPELALVSPKKAKLTLGVMSRCPDAFQVEKLMDSVLRDRRLKDKVEVELVYIGSLNSTAKPYGIDSKHGPLEVAGDVQQLCAQEHLEQEQWWEFLQCQDYYTSRIGTPSLAVQCAKVAGFTWAGSEVEKCVEGKEGGRLARRSVEETRKGGVEKSATIMIGEERTVRCIHDGTWKSCDDGHTVNDFVRSLLAEYDAINA